MKYNKEYNKEHIKLTGDIAKKSLGKAYTYTYK